MKRDFCVCVKTFVLELFCFCFKARRTAFIKASRTAFIKASRTAFIKASRTAFVKARWKVE